MELRVREIAHLVDGEVAGSEDPVIRGVAGFAEARADDITFAATAQFLARLDETGAGAVIVPSSVGRSTKVLVKVSNPYVAFAKISSRFHAISGPAAGIDPMARVGKNFKCGKDVSVYAGVVIGNDVTVGERAVLHPGVVVGDGVSIGDDVVLYPNVSILKHCRIGNRVVIHAGSVIGSDGFGFASDGDRYYKIPQTGIVRIDDDVEIGACNTIDRATFGKTWIKRGVKTDNLVHIAHNVEVGEDTVLVAQVGISGSVTIGSHAILAGQAGVAQHLTIGNRATVGPQAGIGKSIPEGEVISGSPGMPHRVWLRVSGILPKLPDLTRQLKSMEKRVRELEDRLKGT
jgi:UDP-3-O-[3-hydroxymyristoyl] glucosamine N-acyltransferase